MKNPRNGEYPKYHVRIDGVEKFLSHSEIFHLARAKVFDHQPHEIIILKDALNEDDTGRIISEDERKTLEYLITIPGFAPRHDDRYPKYQMVVDGRIVFLPIYSAGVQYDDGFAQVRIGKIVLNEDMTTRPMTQEDRQQISNIADDYSASK